jgi:ubiquinone/menaquinone biosynthesis C-methylase UbiE
MHLRTGIPLVSEVDGLLASEQYARHVEFNKQFLKLHDAAMDRYGKLWAKDTLGHWSRRWEYPYAADRIINHGAEAPDRTYRILDAGSGVTYFPYYVCSELPRAQFTCFDSNATYHGMFEQINAADASGGRVKFLEGMLQQIPIEDRSFDAVCCISVLEHTADHAAILEEFARLLRPGGLLVLSFDLSLDGRFELDRGDAVSLLEHVTRRFVPQGGVDLMEELRRLDSQPQQILSTDYIRRTRPELLPWKYPLAKAVHDLVSGHGWTGGFRSKSVFALCAAAR